MAFRTWARLLLATLGMAALAGAGQLGLAYGLGIVRLTRVLTVTTRDQWTAQLAWVAWFAMTAAVAGALTGSWLLPRWHPALRARAAAPGRLDPPSPGAGTIIAVAVAAGIGAGVVAPLTMQPARYAHVAGVDPVLVIAICGALGAIAGIFAACAALAQAVARWSFITVGIAIWVIAVVSAASSLAPSDPFPDVRLGVFDPSFLSTSTTQRTALITMPALALLAGLALGWRARRQERPTLTIALAGLPGPALLTAAYLLAGPGDGPARYEIVPYWAAMTAAGAGVLGSVLAAVLRRGPAPEDEDEDDKDGDANADKPPLPRRTSSGTESAIAKAGVPAGEETPPGNRPGIEDTGVFDAPSGQVRPAPGGRSPMAAPWSPAASSATASGTASVPSVRRPNVAAAFSPRPPMTAGQPGGVALGEYTEPEPPAFDGFARAQAEARAQAAAGVPTGGGAGAGAQAGGGAQAGVSSSAPAGASVSGPIGAPAGGPIGGAINTSAGVPAGASGSSPAHTPGSGPIGGPARTTAGGPAHTPAGTSGSNPARTLGSGPIGSPAHTPVSATDEGPARTPGLAPVGGPARTTVGGSARASGRTAAGVAAGRDNPYVPEPATRPLPPEVLGSGSPAPERASALSRGLRSLGRSRHTAPEPETNRNATFGSETNRSAALGSEAGTGTGSIPQASSRHAALGLEASRHPAPGPEAGTRTGPVPQAGGRRTVAEPEAISAPLPSPTPLTPPLPNPQPLTTSRPAEPSPVAQAGDATGGSGRFGFGRPATAPRVHLDDTRDDLRAEPQPTTAPQPDASQSGRRFGVRKRKDATEYVDWVSGLGTD